MKGIGSTLKSSIGGLDTRAHYTVYLILTIGLLHQNYFQDGLKFLD